MKFKKLGHTDIDVSLICLGTMNMGEQNTEAQGFEQMDYAFDKGVNFFDTAEVYSVPPREETQAQQRLLLVTGLKNKEKRKDYLSYKNGRSWS